MTAEVPRPMMDFDFDWAEQLLEHRRRRYEKFSPVFWRPAPGVRERHSRHLRNVAAGHGAVALRTDHGFLVATTTDGRCFVDDFAMDADEQWATEGRALLLAAWGSARAQGELVLRVVTAREDGPKRTMLVDLGLVVTARWWVKELTPTGASSAFGPVKLGEADALLVPAPPVYDPGGPVCLLGDIDPLVIAELCQRAEAHGAVLAVVQVDRSPAAAPSSEPELESAGFHNPSEFFEGRPTSKA